MFCLAVIAVCLARVLKLLPNCTQRNFYRLGHFRLLPNHTHITTRPGSEAAGTGAGAGDTPVSQVALWGSTKRVHAVYHPVGHPAGSGGGMGGGVYPHHKAYIRLCPGTRAPRHGHGHPP